MDYRNYADWTEMSGIYVRQYSHGDRYRTFKKQISSEGLNTLIVAEFLHDNPGETLNVPNWRTYSVYEAGGDKRERIELTAAALEAIGASRAAEAVRKAESHSPFDALMQLGGDDPDALMKAIENVNPLDMLGHIRESAARMMPELAEQMGITPDTGPEKTGPEKTGPETTGPASPSAETESWQEIERLLEVYANIHQARLEADLAKHGDPRTRPGYTRAGRLQELEHQQEKYYWRESQLENVPKLRSLMKELEKRFGGGQELPPRMRRQMKSKRQKFLDELKENKKLAAEVSVPEMIALLKEADRFIQANPAIFDEQPVGDTKLEQRLAALGEYERREEFGQSHLIWNKPNGLDVGWHHFALTLAFPDGGETPVVSALMDVAERTRARISVLGEQWRRELIEHFREREGWMQDWELEDAELDDEGQVAEQSILDMVGTGQIVLTAYDKQGEEIRTETYFNIDWDEEHGFEIQWEDEVPEETTSAAQEISLGKVQLFEPGPAVGAADLDRIEQKFGVKLPPEYRTFLRQVNGGTPEPNHLPLRNQGELMPYDVEFFYSVCPDNNAGTVPPERDLEQALAAHWKGNTPRILLPIARLKPYGFSMNSNDHFLFFALAGKKAGQVVLFDDNPLRELAGYRNLDEQARAKAFEAHVGYAFTAGKTLSALFKKLKQPPKIEIPDWLRMIQEDDREGFLAWLEAGGSLKEQHQGYGEFGPTSIVEHLTRDASPELLAELMNRKRIKPKQIRQTWHDRYRYDVDRFCQLMPLLPKDLWPYVMASPLVWDRMDLLEQLAQLGIDFNMSLGDEGERPIHLAVQAGNKEAVQWLMEHGADPHKNDNYHRNAFVWAESGPGYDCLRILEGKPDQPEPTAPPAEDSPGITALTAAAAQLPDDVGLMLRIQIKSPPVTRIEKNYYSECHYILSLDVRRNQVTFKDVLTPRQDYLYASGWPDTLFAPILQWPDLTPLWETLEVEEFDWSKAAKKRNYQGVPRPDLLDAARSALEQGFNPEEANNRGVRLRKN